MLRVVQMTMSRACDWRECKGVEPSAHTEGRTPTDLKSAEPTGTHPLPTVKRKRLRLIARTGRAPRNDAQRTVSTVSALYRL